MRKIFNQTQRKIYGEKSVEFSILSIGALIFGQFISGKTFSLFLMIIGLSIFTVGMMLSYLFLKDVKGGENS